MWGLLQKAGGVKKTPDAPVAIPPDDPVSGCFTPHGDLLYSPPVGKRIWVQNRVFPLD
ncbi:hypothetical protein [Corynebacterium efficiens YS-314]|uniref:Uncharacterized protein n=1 Tax=Corynebacterium efficiens (strain DSM 44549 / YS-314 / AJ 12310 / JCM 11189 / NBRC 100395) TaxID=196164 RepID=Q8FNY9_COREF|nr:hypothetical protein [Corynebacterium efficiens YS-314]